MCDSKHQTHFVVKMFTGAKELRRNNFYIRTVVKQVFCVLYHITILKEAAIF